MSAHLSEDQICRCVTGEAGREQRAHLEACADCASKVARTRTALLNFGAIARDYSATVAGEGHRGTAGAAVTGAPIAGRWIPVLSAAFVLLLAIGGVTYSLNSRAPARLPVRAIDDAVLLNRIRDDVGRSAPHSLAPLLDPGLQRGEE
jgi:hypothetical protein